MITSVKQSTFLSIRSMRVLGREPVYLAFTLLQPMVWLLLFSQVFERVTDLPGFGTTNYITYLTPGVIVMTAIMSSNWAGTGFIEDMKRGVMDRNLTSPVSRIALVNGTLSYWAVVTVVQALIVFGVGFLMGARYDGGLLGILVCILAACLLAVFFAGFSCAMALIVRSQESLIGMSMFLVLPLTFLSSVLIAPELLPGWIETVAMFNPVDWAAVASREAVLAGTDWGAVWTRIGLLTGLVAAMAWLASGAFKVYRQSV